MAVSVPFRGLGSEKQLSRREQKALKLRVVSVPFRGLGSEKLYTEQWEREGGEVFPSPFGD